MQFIFFFLLVGVINSILPYIIIYYYRHSVIHHNKGLKIITTHSNIEQCFFSKKDTNIPITVFTLNFKFYSTIHVIRVSKLKKVHYII